MKRLGIFVLYDEEGIVDEFVEQIILKMQEVIDKLVIVVNGELERESEKILQKYSVEIFCRKNVGYDGGAYKDAVLHFIPKSEWEQYDEAVFFNDTFYGPFFSMELLFEKFKLENVDFWGLSKWIDGRSELLQQKLPEHLQTYFLVVKKNLLRSSSFFDYWLTLDYPLSYEDAVLNFEVGFTTYFSNRGYRYKSWIEVQGAEQLLESGKVIYHAHPRDLILTYHFPVLKRKTINMYNIGEMIQILEYIKDTYRFDISVIWKHLKRLERKKRLTPFSFVDIDEFYRCHERMYIFGCGEWGRRIEAYFKYWGRKIDGFIVTDNRNNKRAYNLADIILNEKDGIIIALGKDNLKQVQDMLLEKFSKNQIYFPVYE